MDDERRELEQIGCCKTKTWAKLIIYVNLLFCCVGVVASALGLLGLLFLGGKTPEKGTDEAAKRQFALIALPVCIGVLGLFAWIYHRALDGINELVSSKIYPLVVFQILELALGTLVAIVGAYQMPTSLIGLAGRLLLNVFVTYVIVKTYKLVQLEESQAPPAPGFSPLNIGKC